MAWFEHPLLIIKMAFFQASGTLGNDFASKTISRTRCVNGPQRLPSARHQGGSEMISSSRVVNRCSGPPSPRPSCWSLANQNECDAAATPGGHSPASMNSVIVKGKFEMKKMRTLVRRNARLALIVPFAALLYGPTPAAATPFLGTAEQFAVLGATPSVTNTTPTTINGDVGIYPAASITGMSDITLIGASTYQIGNAVAQGAQADSSTAFTTLAGLPSTDNLSGSGPGLGRRADTRGLYV